MWRCLAPEDSSIIGQGEFMKKYRLVLGCMAVSLMAGVLAGCPAVESPVSRALLYLAREQADKDLRLGPYHEFAGNWPQFIRVEDMQGVRVPDVSPFIPAFIHHALTLVNEDTVERLGLTRDEAMVARSMRQRAAAFVKRFESPAHAPCAGAYGFWPYVRVEARTGGLWAFLSVLYFQGPLLYGTRVPLSIPFYPNAMAIPADADDTAAAYLVLLHDALLDGGPGSEASIEHFFTDWRDLGQVPRRINPLWLPPASGAFLTWLNYKQPPDFSIPNDVDLGVNANVLHALARHGRLDTPGAPEAIALINDAVRRGVHRTDPENSLPYYATDGYAFHYFVSRAYADGPVPGLKPAVELLADEVERDARHLPGGMAFWNKGGAHLDTALALLTLMHAGRDTALVDRGVAWLAAVQNPAHGGWREGVFFTGRMDNGRKFLYVSPALTTAMALEALCRHALLNPETGAGALPAGEQ
jgi:hypothetical protein